MSIGPIGSTTAIASVYGPTNPDGDDQAQATGIAGAATQTTVSKEGSVFAQLAALARSSPDQFKAAASEIAQKLKDEASQATGDKASRLASLADRFSQAAQTGDLSALKPEGHRGHGHHGRHHGGGAGQASDAGTSLAQVIEQAMQDVTGGGQAAAAATQVAQAAVTST